MTDGESRDAGGVMDYTLGCEGVEEKELVPFSPASLQCPAQRVAGDASDLIGQRQNVQLIHDPKSQHGLILRHKQDKARERDHG